MKRPIKRLAVSLTALLAATPALARDDDVILLDTITVTASSQPVDLSRTGATVDVITAEDIADAPLSFAGFLSRLPSVNLTANGGLGAATSLRVRGLPAYYVGTRIDGLDVTDPSGTQLLFNFGALTTAGLSRIEVLRGSQSALYGSEAVAGVIDVTSWRPQQDGVSGQAGVEAGANGTSSGSVSVGFRDARTELAFTLSRTVTEGISAFDGGTEDDGFRGTTATAYARHALTDSLAIGASLFLQDSFAEYDGPAADADRWAESDQRGGRVFLQYDAGAVSHELSLARMKQDRDVYEFASHTFFVGERNTIAYDGRWDAGSALALNWGLERKEEDFSVVSAFSTTVNGVSTTSAFAEALYAPTETLDLSLALRHDDHSLFGGQASGRAALAWRPTEDWVIRAVAATGFRAPSPYELWSSYGDPTFQPEESRSLELGVERQFASGSLRATLFDTRVEDQIIFDTTAFVYDQVAGTTESRGIELSGQADLGGGFRLFGNYTYSDVTIEDATGSRRGIRAPRHVVMLGLAGDFASGWGTEFTVQHVADRIDENTAVFPPVRVTMPDYTVANLAVSYDLTDAAQAYLRVENLFDADYQTARNYGQPGRSLYVGLRTSF